MTTLFILYVRDQAVSARFYAAVLAEAPILDVPGMTEFSLGADVRLGLMPEAGIRRLLGDAILDPASAAGVPRAELYLKRDDAPAMLGRAMAAGARALSDWAPRDWGDHAAYVADPDGHILALAAAAGPA